MKDKFIRLYSDIARRTAEMSSARRLHVGAIVVKDNRIISLGYNGMPEGWDNNCEYDDIRIESSTFGEPTIITNRGLKTRPEVLHAESNAIAKLARSTESGENATMFITHSPCLECAKLIYQSGIRAVYFGQQYRDTSGIEFLKKCNIQVDQFE